MQHSQLRDATDFLQGASMINFFQSTARTTLSGVALLIVLLLLAALRSGEWLGPSNGGLLFIVKWVYVASGILWIGLVWFFNLIWIPSMPKVPAEHRAGAIKVLAPALTFWFRWSAAVAVIAGLILAIANGEAIPRLLFSGDGMAASFANWLGIVMAANVWFVMWRNQKKAMGIVDGTAEEKAKAGRMAMLASRMNMVLSIPLVYMLSA